MRRGPTPANRGESEAGVRLACQNRLPLSGAAQPQKTRRICRPLSMKAHSAGPRLRCCLMNVQPQYTFTVHDGAPSVGDHANDDNLLQKGCPFIMGSSNDAVVERVHPAKDIGYRWIGELMSPEYALISAQNAKNVSGYSSIRQECCKIDSCAAGAPTGPDSMLSRSGKKSTKQKRKSVDYCVRQGPKLGQREEILLCAQTFHLNVEKSP